MTERALEAGIAAAVIGNHIGDIGAAVQAVVEGAGFSVVRDLVGHGIGMEFHEEPQVPNYGKPKRAMKLAPGLTIAIEPMVNVGTPKTRTMPDRWTMVTADGSRAAHFEHTVAITDAGPQDPDGVRDELTDRAVEMESERLFLVRHTAEALLALIEHPEHYEEISGFPAAPALREFFISDDVSAEFLAICDYSITRIRGFPDSV